MPWVPMAGSEWQPQLREHVRSIGLIRARELLAEGEFKHAHYDVAREEISIMEREATEASERVTRAIAQSAVNTSRASAWAAAFSLIASLVALYFSLNPAAK